MAKNVLILSFTPVTDEPRVLRQSRSFEKAGWKISVCGMPGRAKKPESWNLWVFSNLSKNSIILEKIDSDLSIHNASSSAATQVKKPFYHALSSKLPKSLRKIAKNILYGTPTAFSLILTRFSDKSALKFYWQHFYYQTLFDKLYPAILAERERKPDLIIAHDYFTAPLAEKMAGLLGCKFVIDVHEYANAQFMHSILWRIFYRPWVKRIQGIYLKKSAFNTTVCEGIGDLLSRDYPGLTKPTVIRSTPFFAPMAFNAAGDNMTVLYHGIIYHTRGLDMALESLPRWKPNFKLVFRGPGSTDYIEYLKQKAKSLGVADRLTIEPPALFHEIIPAANKADIGYFIHEDISPQKKFTLPNKFFEYIMAGLALCVSDLPEMRRIVKQYDLGTLVDGYDPVVIANAINSMDTQTVNMAKKNSLAAAKDLCWENESVALIKAYEALVSR